jgi:hypothetical protein
LVWFACRRQKANGGEDCRSLIAWFPGGRDTARGKLGCGWSIHEVWVVLRFGACDFVFELGVWEVAW